MEKAVGYEQRRRIRAQIRVVRRLISENKISYTPSKKPKVSPSTKDTPQTIVKKSSFTEVKTRDTSDSQPSNRNFETKLVDRREQSRSIVTQAVDSVSQFQSQSFKTQRKVMTKTENYVQSAVEKIGVDKEDSVVRKFVTTRKGESKKVSQSTDDKPTTDCITSSYGIGPTDENGLPLFGIRALRKAGREQVHG